MHDDLNHQIKPTRRQITTAKPPKTNKGTGERAQRREKRERREKKLEGKRDIND